MICEMTGIDKGGKPVKIFRWIAVSFSLYSRIPMPRFPWDEDDMKHSLSFFPLIGLLIGALICGLHMNPFVFELPLFIKTILTVLIPILITGGFHLDGFMDTEDAIRSYRDRERKLEIMKDAHVGAFAVIGLLIVTLFFLAGTGLLLYAGDDGTIIVFALIFAESRALSGICSMFFDKARKDGMLASETAEKKKSVVVFLFIWLAAVIAAAFFIAPIPAAFMQAAFVLFTVYYRILTYRQFGGVTGDTAGYYVTVSELSAVIFIALGVLIFR